MTMSEFNKLNGTMMWDPNIESCVRAQHSHSEDYQNFKLRRTDLMSFEERAAYFREHQF